jgi:hypothetical protein
MNSSSAGGGGRTLNWIGINLSPGTREVANGTSVDNLNGKDFCERAVAFYDFLTKKNKEFYVPVPTVTMENIGLIKKIVSDILPFPLKGNTTIDEDKNVQLSNTFCFDNKSKMNTDYLINNDIPGYLTMIGFTKNDADDDVVWYVLTLYFGKKQNGEVSVTIDGFCKNNDLMINGSRIGVDNLLSLCEEFNKTENFKIIYCVLDALPEAMSWWELFGFKRKVKGGYGGSIMKRNFPATVTPLPAINLSSELVTPLPAINLSSEPVTPKEFEKDELEDKLFEKLRMLSPEDLSNIKSGPVSDDDYDFEPDEEPSAPIIRRLNSPTVDDAQEANEELEEKNTTITGKKYKPEEEDYFKNVKRRLIGGSKTNKKKKKSDKNKKKTNKNKRKTNKKNTKRKVKRSRRRTRRF